MPVAECSIKGLTSHIINPIVEQLTNRILKFLRIYKHFNNNIYFHSLDQVADNYKTQLPHKQNKLSTTNRCDVEVVTSYNPKETQFELLIPKFIHTQNQNYGKWIRPIFVDTTHDVRLEEHHVPCSIQLNFTFRLSSLTLADEVAYSLYNQLTSNQYATYHEYIYQYPIEPILIIILYNIWKLTDYKDNNDQPVDFQTYLSGGSDRHIDITINRHKTSLGEIIIKQAKNYALGMFQYPANPPDKIEVNKFVDGYTITLSHVVQLSIPSRLRLEYPVTINNQYLPEQYLNVEINSTQSNNTLVGYDDIQYGDYIVARQHKFHEVLDLPPYIMYPPEDTWNIPLDTDINITSNTDYLCRFILQPTLNTDTANYYVELDLINDYFPILDDNDLQEVKEALMFYLTEENWIDIVSHRAPICCYMFSNDNKVPFNLLTLNRDDDNNVFKIRYEHENVSLRKTYRILLGINSNYYKIQPKYVMSMFNYPKVFGKLINLNYKRMEQDGFIEVIDQIAYSRYNLGIAGQHYPRLFTVGGIPVRIHNYLIAIK